MAQHSTTPSFVGRMRELGDLGGHLEEGRAGRGRLVLVAGEPGMGKTRLLEELAADARTRGTACLWATCREGDGAPPLWPWVQALRALEPNRSPDTDLAALLDEAEPEGGLLGDVDPAGLRFRRFDRVVAQFRDAAERRPLLVVLDDLHWADRSSLLLLSQIASTLPTTRLVIVGAYRDSEIGDALGEVLDALPADTDRITLVGLDADSVVELAGSVSGTQISSADARDLHRHTGGNPFFVRELVRLMHAQHQATTHDVPAGVRDVLARRIARCSQECRATLRAAAVIGLDFDVRVLAAVVEGSDTLSQALDEAAARRIVVDLGFDRFSFAHDLFRQVLYSQLGRAERVRLHLAVGEALETQHAHDIEGRLGELAHHFLASLSAGDARRAVEYSRRAGQRAARLLAFEEAAAHFEHSLTAMSAGTATAEERAAILCALGDARWRAQDIAGAQQALADAAAVARSIGDAPTFAEAALAYACGLGGNQPLARADRTLIQLLDEALVLLPDADSVLRCRAMARLAVELSLTADRKRGMQLSADALDMARRLEEPSALAAALYGRQIAVFGPDGLEERQSAADEMVLLAQRANDRELELWGNLFRVWALAERCLPVTFELATCARQAEQLQLPGYRAEVALRQAVLAIVAGEFDEAERLLEQVHAAPATDAAISSSLVGFMALDALLRGPLDTIEPMVAQTVVDYPEKPMWRGALMVLHTEIGRLEDARRQFDVLAATNFDLPRDGLWLHAMYFLSYTCFALGDAEHARVLHGLLRPHAHQAPIGAFGSMATPLGLLDATGGRYENALRWLDVGHERNIAMRNRAFAAFTRRERAAVLLARDGPGDRAAARAILEPLNVELRDQGFTGFVGRAERLLQAAGSADATPTGDDRVVLRREGPSWVARYRDATVRLAPSKGVADLAVLLECPGREVPAVDLVGAPTTADTGELLDSRARRELRARILDLEAELTEAEAAGDAGRAERLRAERDAIVDHLSAALGLGGRARRGGDERERARKTVTWRIRQAIRAIAAEHSALGAHLDRSVRTGTFCSYRPD